MSAWPEWPGFPATARTLTQLEMFQNPIKIILGRTLGHTPLGIFAGFQVLDSDLFFGFLSLVLHVCYFSFAGQTVRARDYGQEAVFLSMLIFETKLQGFDNLLGLLLVSESGSTL